MENIDWEEKAKYILQKEQLEFNAGIEGEIIDFAIEFAKLACEEQKKICTENVIMLTYQEDKDGIRIRKAVNTVTPYKLRNEYGRKYYIDINKDSILNAPTVKFS